MNPILARTAAGLRAIRVARDRGKRHGESCDCAMLAYCRAADWQIATARRGLLRVMRIAKGGIN